MHSWLASIKQQLTRQFIDKTLPHALVFSGVNGSGHEELGHWLSGLLICQTAEHITQYHENEILTACGYCKTCKLHRADNYPDHMTLSTDKSTLGVDAVRGVSAFFEKTSHIGHAKTALIPEADKMTISAANALLKTLEEPTDNSYIILTTEQRANLLATIVSRCQVIEIRPPVGAELLANMNQQVNDPFVNLSHFPELSDEKVAASYHAFIDNLQNYLCYHQNRAQLVAQLTEQKHAYRWFEKLIVDMMRDCWNWQSIDNSLTELAKAMNKDKLWQIYNCLQSANKQLQTLTQINKSFLTEKLLVDISFILKSTEE